MDAILVPMLTEADGLGESCSSSGEGGGDGRDGVMGGRDDGLGLAGLPASGREGDGGA